MHTVSDLWKTGCNHVTCLMLQLLLHLKMGTELNVRISNLGRILFSKQSTQQKWQQIMKFAVGFDPYVLQKRTTNEKHMTTGPTASPRCSFVRVSKTQSIAERLAYWMIAFLGMIDLNG